jgi:hypothetical protein
MDYIDLTQERNRWWAFVKAVMNLASSMNFFFGGGRISLLAEDSADQEAP